ncbi:MAG: acyl carrier protein [Gemmatimonadales bacterium]|nr:acyl carrier protein [Gemmatimonadota bacterium]MCC7133971.1 acyl carrier protein [Gemmatimonadales bacterium]MDX2058198.1 acyl carrier protein [Gemmatimonadales bacterium]
MTSPEELVARAFGVAASQVTDQTSNQNLPEWDSLGHITLVVELESTYGVSLSPDEALQVTSVDAIKKMLTARGISW